MAKKKIEGLKVRLCFTNFQIPFAKCMIKRNLVVIIIIHVQCVSLQK